MKHSIYQCNSPNTLIRLCQNIAYFLWFFRRQRFSSFGFWQHWCIHVSSQQQTTHVVVVDTKGNCWSDQLFGRQLYGWTSGFWILSQHRRRNQSCQCLSFLTTEKKCKIIDCLISRLIAMVSSSSSSDSVTKHNTTNESITSLDKELAIPHNIDTVKWQDIREDEDLLEIGNAVAREIVENSLTKIYERYLEKKSHDFVVACSQVAFMQYFNVSLVNHFGSLFPVMNSSVINHVLHLFSWKKKQLKNMEVMRDPETVGPMRSIWASNVTPARRKYYSWAYPAFRVLSREFNYVTCDEDCSFINKLTESNEELSSRKMDNKSSYSAIDDLEDYKVPVQLRRRESYISRENCYFEHNWSWAIIIFIVKCSPNKWSSTASRWVQQKKR